MRNFARLHLGATATASTTYSAGYEPETAIDGDRTTKGIWGTGGGWASANSFPQWLEVNLGQPRKIRRIIVVTLRDDLGDTRIVDDNMEFSLYGVTDFDVQYHDGTGWVTVGSASGNTKIIRRFDFPEVETDRIRAYVTSGAYVAARIVSLEAWGNNDFRRPLSSVIRTYFANRAQLNNRAYNTEQAVQITLQDGTIVNWATRRLTINSVAQDEVSEEIDPIFFSPRIEGAPEFRHSQGRAVDGGELEATDLDYFIGQLIPNNQRLLDGAKVTLYWCYPKGGGMYEGQVYFVGLVNTLESDGEVATLRVISDIDVRVATLGKEMTQRCLNTLGDDWCSVTSLPPGAVCSKVHGDRDGGCAYWGGVFNGVPYLNPSGLVSGYSGNLPDDPWQDTGGQPAQDCPDPDNFFRLKGGGVIMGWDLRPGMEIMWNDTPVTVIKAEVVDCAYRYRVETRFGAKTIISASHRFLTNARDNRGESAHGFFNNHYSFILRTPQGRRSQRKFLSLNDIEGKGYIIKPTEPGKVLRLSVTHPHKYDCGFSPHIMFENHNMKNYYEYFPY